MGGGIPEQVVLGGMRKGTKCEPKEQTSRQHPPWPLLISSLQVPALTPTLASPGVGLKPAGQINPFLPKLLLAIWFFSKQEKSF